MFKDIIWLNIYLKKNALLIKLDYLRVIL